MKKVNSKLIYNLIEFLFVCWGLTVLFDFGTRNIFAFIFACGWLVIKNRTDGFEFDKAENWAVIILTALFSICTILVTLPRIRDDYNGIERMCCSVVLLGGIYLLFYVFVKYLWRLASNIKWFTVNSTKLSLKKVFWLSFWVVFGFLLAGLILDLPGDISKDSVGIIRQALVDERMNAGFSFVTIWTMRACLSVANMMGTGATGGVIIYLVLQIVLISLIVAYLLLVMAELGVNRVYLLIAAVFYGIMPYNNQLCHTVWKDIPFSFCCILFMTIIFENINNAKNDVLWRHWLRAVLFVLSGIGMCIFRTNGYYAFIFFIPFCLVGFWNYNRKVCVLLLITFAMTYVVRGPISDYVVNEHNKKVIQLNKQDENVKVKTDNSNMLQSYGASGVHITTIQQIAAVAFNRTDLTQEDWKLISEVLDVEKLRENYAPNISDNTLKARVKVDTKRYLQIWLRLGLKYPSTYIAAWKNMTSGYWYPEMDERWIYIDEMPANDYGIEKIEFLPSQFYRVREKIEGLYRHIPVYGMLWSIGFAVWVTAFCIALTVVKKGWKYVLYFIPVIGVWLTLLVATPVNGEFRYIYPVFLSLPLSLIIPYLSNRGNQN